LKKEVDRSEKIQFGLRECRVILEDIGHSYIISESTRSSSSKRGISKRTIIILFKRCCNRFIIVLEGRFQSLCFRVKVMESKVRIADEELRNSSCKKNDATKKIQEITALKEKIENDLRAEEWRALELAEKRNQLNKMEDELLPLREEEEYLTEEFRIAEGSFIGATQVLLALKSDLKELESD